MQDKLRQQGNLLQRVQACYGALAPAAQRDVFECLKQVGMETLLALALPRKIHRQQNLEVWGEVR